MITHFRKKNLPDLKIPPWEGQNEWDPLPWVQECGWGFLSMILGFFVFGVGSIVNQKSFG